MKVSTLVSRSAVWFLLVVVPVANSASALGAASGPPSAQSSASSLARPTRDPSLFAPSAAPSCTLDWIPTFTSHGVPAGWIDSFVEFDDGSGPALYVSGYFSGVGGLPAQNVAKWNGSAWSTLGAGLDAECYELAVYDDGSGPALYAAGMFGHAGGALAAGIAKWSGGTWHPLGSGLAGHFNVNFPTYGLALVVHDDGSGSALYVAGDFTSAGGISAKGIARWNGSSWSAVGGGFDNDGASLAVFDDGTGPALYAGGRFTVPASGIAKWNGSAWSSLGSGVHGGGAYVGALVSYPNSGAPSLYVGGGFLNAGGVAADGLARWDGNQWHAAGDVKRPSQQLDGAVSALSVFDGGSGPELYAGGSFETIAGVSANNIAKWDGSAWSPLGTGTSANAVFALAPFTDGSGLGLYVGGDFSTAGGIATGSMARWSGSSWSSFFSGAQWIYAVALFDDGLGGGPALYAAGSIVPAPGAPQAAVARWNGSSWTSITPGPTGPNDVYTLTVFDDGSGPALYAGGGFTTIGGVSANRLARWNGSAWTQVGSGMDGPVYKLAVLDDGSGPLLYAGGSFTHASGVAAGGIAKFNGAHWSSLATVSGFVTDIALFDEGAGPRLFIAGSVTPTVDPPVSYIARWNGIGWSTVGGSLSNSATALIVFDDGTGPALYVGGSFAAAGGASAGRIAKWNGSAWSTLGPGFDSFPSPESQVVALAVFDGGSGAQLYAGGLFTHASGAPAANVARWNGASWSPLGNGVNYVVHALAALPFGGNSLYIGGEFFASPGGDAALARWGCGAMLGTRFCFGDGTQATPCPCANSGAPGSGCQNSAGTGGAVLGAVGTTQPDTVILTSSRELPSVLSIFLQGTSDITGLAFGDGVRCVGGVLKRLYVKTASGGVASAPGPGDLTVSARSASLGDVIAPGTTRSYQAYYRDPNLGFCPPPAGNNWNVSSAVRITW